MIVDYMDIDFLQGPDESRLTGGSRSILVRKSVAADTILYDYREHLNSTLNRTGKTHLFDETVLGKAGVEDLTEADIIDLNHHAHSDQESDADDDPYFEYNKCNRPTMLFNLPNKKIAEEFEEIEISRFFTKTSDEEPVKVIVYEEVNRLVDAKYLDAMEKLVAADNIVDDKEWEAFDRYAQRGKHMSDNTGIPNYEQCWKPLP